MISVFQKRLNGIIRDFTEDFTISVFVGHTAQLAGKSGQIASVQLHKIDTAAEWPVLYQRMAHSGLGVMHDLSPVLVVASGRRQSGARPR